MPVISPRRYSTTTGSSSYLPPSVGGTTSSLAKASSSYGSSGYGSSYRSSSLSNSSSSYSSGGYSSGTSPASSYLSRNSAYRSSLYNSSSSLSGTSAISPLSYRPSSYLSGGNNDTTATSRFGVSSNRYTRSSSDRETTRRITGKTQHNNNINTNRSKTLQTKPPIVGSSSSIRNQRPSSESRSRDNSLTRVTSKSDPNSNCINNNNSESIESKNKISSSLSSSSLARQVATSGLDLYEKYSPAHYIPKCELSRSRSLSEATSNKYINDNGLSNSSSNVHQLLQTKEINNKQEKQENDTQNQKSSSPSHQTTSSSSSSKDISTAQLASKVKKLCAVSTIATNNQSKSASSVVAINNNSTTITNENNYSNNASNSSTSYLKYPVKQLNKSTTPQYLAGLNLNAKHYNNHYIHDNITNTTNSITSVKPICSVVNIVTNHIQNPSEHDSKHSNVIKTATTVQSHQINTSSILYSTYNNNSPPNSITSCNKFDRKLRNNYTTITTTSIPASATFSKEQATQLSSFSAVPSGSTNCSSQVFCNDLNTKSSIINANALLKAAKSNLKPTKQFLSNKIDDKTMSSYYCASNGNINNPNSDCSNSTTTPVTLVNNIAPSSSSSSPSSPTILSTGGGDKSKSLKTNKTNILDFRLEFYKNKLQSGENTTAGSLSAINGSVAAKGGNNTNNNNNNQFIGLTYREPNFLKTECELARSQVVRSDQNSSNHSYENNNIILNNGQEKLNKYEKNIIKPLVHKPTNNKLQQLSRTLSNNNMNCLQNSPDLLDDIKYIDSDDSERQQNHHNHHHHHHHNSHQHHHHHSHHHNNSQSKSASSSATAAGTTTVVCPSPSKLIANRKDLSYVTNNKTSTLPLTSKHHRDLIHSDSSPNKNATNNKYNTLNDFKRIPSSLSNNFKSSHYKTNDVLSSSSSSPSSSTTTPIKTIISNNLTKSTVTMIHHNGTASRESTPSNSPQTLRRRNALSNSSNLLQNSNEGLSTSSSSLKSTSVLQPQQQQQSSYSPVTINDKKLSNKLCDNDESVRNASIRSALPPSPTPSRYWDREGRSSLASRNQNDSDDSTTTKSSLSTSNSYDKTATEGLCGLRNIGNTCYMNSVIQCLSHTRELTKFLKTHMGIKSSSKDHQILIEFSKLIREMWSPNVRSVTPLELKSAFSTKHRMYSGYNQQDAQEFLRFFLDSLHSSLNSGVKGEQLKIDDSLSDNKKADLTWEWYAKIENSVVRDLFVGQLKSTLKCTVCGNTSVTFDPFWDLSVPLPSSSRCKLDACLELFIREEVLDGDEMPTCSKCQTRRKCTKSFTIQRFPKYLVIHLKRFSETRWSKLSNVVEFPTGERELNMAPYASNSNGSATYSLYGISNHMGSTAGGHYVALCKHPTTKKWHEFNDNVVSDDLSDSVLVSSSAYILFYERA